MRAEMVVVLIGDVTCSKFTVDHYSELSFFGSNFPFFVAMVTFCI